MATLEDFAQLLGQRGAPSLTMIAGQTVVLGWDHGDERLGAAPSNEDITQMLLASAPRDALDKLQGGMAPHPYALDAEGAQYEVKVGFRGDAWRVTLRPGTAIGQDDEVLEGEVLEGEVLEGEVLEDFEEVPAAAPSAQAEHAPAPQPANTAQSAAADSRTITPSRSDAHQLLDRLLAQMCRDDASDLHLSANRAPQYRVSGAIRTIPQWKAIPEQLLAGMCLSIMPDRNRTQFQETFDTDFAYEIDGLSRFRVNVGKDMHGVFSVIRRIPHEILTPEQIGLPKDALKLCYLTKGLVLVTGPTGSGKSTTLATMVDYINENRDDHIITIEDPVEFVHSNEKRCLVRQREVGMHTKSFKSALKAALREDPDIILIGEMRDLETIAIAIETAETGHLVFGTLHTTTAPSTVDRLIDQFPADQQDQIRVMLSESLKGVIAQCLCRKIGGGRVAAYEIMLPNKGMANLIREGKTFQLTSMMQMGKKAGNITLNDSLMNLVRAGTIDPQEAYVKAVDKDELAKALEKEGMADEIKLVE